MRLTLPVSVERRGRKANPYEGVIQMLWNEFRVGQPTTEEQHIFGDGKEWHLPTLLSQAIF